MFGLSLGGSKSDSDSKSNFDQNVWGAQSPYLTGMYGDAANLFGTSNAGMQGMIPWATNNMQGIFNQSNPYWNQQMQGGAYSGVDAGAIQNQLFDSMNQPSAMQDINRMIMGGEGNDYADAMKGQVMQNAQDLGGQFMNQTDLRGSASGLPGSSRHGIVQSQGLQDINESAMNDLTKLGYDTFDKDLNRKLSIADQADQAGLARQGMLQNMLSGQQNAMQGGLNYGSNMQNLAMGGFSPYMAPWMPMQQYSGIIGAPQVLSSGSSLVLLKVNPSAVDLD